MSNFHLHVVVKIKVEHSAAAEAQGILSTLFYTKLALVTFDESDFSLGSHKWFDKTELSYIFKGEVSEDNSIRACLDFKAYIMDNVKRLLPAAEIEVR